MPQVPGRKTDLKNKLNRSTPAAKDAALGDVLYDLLNKYNALLAKLDADAGVTDANFVSTLKVKLPEDR